MTAATKRVLINKTCYMPVGGQWQIVLSGSVIDVAGTPDLTAVIDPTFSESPGTLANHGGNTPVRNLRTR